MARSTGSGAVEAIQRQVCRVRRRRNLRELQRALYLLIAVGTGGATALVLLALTASPRLFARAVAAVAAATLGAVLVIVRDAGRRWMRADRAAPWIDRRGGLTGRLATLFELGRRGEAEAPLLPLLVEQNVARLALWRPDRLVPRRVPRAALAAAASGLTLLALIVALAPRLRPQAPEVVAGEVSAPALDAVDLSVERLAVDEDIAGMPGAGPDEGPAAAGLQERIRRELWGAPAPASSVPVRRSAHVREEAPADAAGDDALEAARSVERAGREEGAGGDGRQAAGETQGIQEGGHGLLEQPRDGDDEASRSGGATAGAGSQPDPHLFGPPSRDAPGTSQRFALSLAARVHAGRGGPGEGAAPPPAPTPDAHADLAAGQRAEAAVPRMPVPPAYEALVRRHFGREGLP